MGMREITFEVPVSLWEELQPFRDRLLEILERGLWDVRVERHTRYFWDEDAIAKLLASRPSPEQVLSIRPSPGLQARVSELLKRSKEGTLSRKEESELERYLTLEHLVRLAKAHAYEQLTARRQP